MRAVYLTLLNLIAASGLAALAAQTPLGKDAAELRAHLALQALGRYLETWNSRDPERWAEAVEAVQVSANGVNVAVTYSRRDRTGQTFSRYEAVILVVRGTDAWRVQAVSTMGT